MKATLTTGIVVEGTPEELERFLQLQTTIPKPPTPAPTGSAPGVPAHVTPVKPTTLPQTKAPAPPKALGGAAGT